MVRNKESLSMEVINSKTIYYPENGLFMCEVLLKKRWDGACLVEVWDCEPAIFSSKAMKKAFVEQEKAELFFNTKVEELTEAAI